MAEGKGECVSVCVCVRARTSMSVHAPPEYVPMHVKAYMYVLERVGPEP